MQLLGYECELRGPGFIDISPRYRHVQTVEIEDEYFLLMNPQGRLRTSNVTYPTSDVPLKRKLTYKYDKENTSGRDRMIWESEDILTEEDLKSTKQFMHERGYRTILTVRGIRKVYEEVSGPEFEEQENSALKIGNLSLHPKRITICLDDVEGLGKHTELEVLTPDHGELSTIWEILHYTARSFGLTKLDRRTYPEMMFENLVGKYILTDKYPPTISDLAHIYRCIPSLMERSCRNLESKGVVLSRDGRFYPAPKKPETREERRKDRLLQELEKERQRKAIKKGGRNRR